MSDQQCSKLNIGEGCGNHVAFGELSHAIKSWAEECQNHMSHKLNLENPQKRNIVKVKTGTIFARYRSKQTSYCAKKKITCKYYQQKRRNKHSCNHSAYPISTLIK
uniref:(northern house mosquito) hypothetical protein n=1 Tax=Culex pipiens TaxID=7175 RepID=A0A8D8FBF4_CULPI